MQDFPEAFEGPQKKGTCQIYIRPKCGHVSTVWQDWRETWLVVNKSENPLWFQNTGQVGTWNGLGHSLPAALGEALLSNAGSWPF